MKLLADFLPIILFFAAFKIAGSDKEAAAALKALPADVGVSDGIKLALKALSKG